MSRAYRAAHDIGNLFERHAAPESGDNDLAVVCRQAFQSLDGGIGIQAVDLALGEPADRLGRYRFAPLPTSISFASVNGTIAYDAIKPGDSVHGQSSLHRQLAKRFLDNVFGRGTPLPGKQHQARGVRVDQSCKLPAGHFMIKTTRGERFSADLVRHKKAKWRRHSF
jgi:hypothetical protein